jgi:CMP-N,N'-diacetyllegionaminic acid synthase
LCHGYLDIISCRELERDKNKISKALLIISYYKEILIVIPARGGSKGLPRKNARMLGDIPLLGWTAEAIKQSGLSEATCILSTDDEAIANIGRTVGLEVPFTRPSELAQDEATADGVALHALNWMVEATGVKPKLVMLLQPTSPFRPPEAILKAVKMLEDPSIDGVIGVKPIYRSLSTLYFSDENMNMLPLDKDEKLQSRRQDVNPIYTPNGTLYLIRAEKLREPKSFFPEKMKGIIMDQISSIDIDDPIDWKLAEAVVNGKLSWRDNSN